MFAILYTRHLTQKKKVWYDGTLHATGKKCVIYDEDKKVVDTAWIKPEDIVVGEDLRIASFILSIQNKLAATVASEPLTPMLGKKNTTNTNSLPRKANISTSQDSLLPKKGTKRLGGKRGTFKKPALSTPISKPIIPVKPALQRVITAKPGAGHASLPSLNSLPRKQDIYTIDDDDDMDIHMLNMQYNRGENRKENSSSIMRMTPAPSGGRSLQTIIAYLES